MEILRSTMRFRGYQEVCDARPGGCPLAGRSCRSRVFLPGQKIKLVIAAALWNNPQVRADDVRGVTDWNGAHADLRVG